MIRIIIKNIPGIEEWRERAVNALNDGLAPELIVWQTEQEIQDDLFALTRSSHETPPRTNENLPYDRFLTEGRHRPVHISKIFSELCDMALCHRSQDRFFLCYRVLWRLTHENKNLLHLNTDSDILRLNTFAKAVRRDAYKMTAFLRFREIHHNGTEHFIAWYEPEHYTLELKLDFFKMRFKNMRWSILTPYRAAHWDTKCLMLEDNPDPSVYPREDHIEKYWLTYYANIFNPARSKKDAMLSQMPKKYWKNMPETRLIDGMLKKSEAKTREMLEKA